MAIELATNTFKARCPHCDRTASFYEIQLVIMTKKKALKYKYITLYDIYIYVVNNFIFNLFEIDIDIKKNI